MRRLGTSRTALMAASLVIAVGASGCGLGDIPTREPRPTVPPTPSPTPVPTPVPPPTASPSPTPKPSPTPLIYTVKAGDNLLTIAKRFKTSGRSIAYWNRTTYPSLDPDSPKYDPNRIEVGWKLSIIPGVKIEDAAESPSASSPTPEPTISLGPAETPPADGTGLLVTHGSRTSNVVVLTFDLGGPSEPALPIVSWLVEHEVPATFFTTGELAQGDPTARSALALIAAHRELFSVGAGTWTDVDPTGLSASALADQLGRTASAIEATTGDVQQAALPAVGRRPERRGPGCRCVGRVSVHRTLGHRSRRSRCGLGSRPVDRRHRDRDHGPSPAGLDRPAPPRRPGHARGAARDPRRPGRRQAPAGDPDDDAPALTRRSVAVAGAILSRWIDRGSS